MSTDCFAGISLITFSPWSTWSKICTVFSAGVSPLLNCRDLRLRASARLSFSLQSETTMVWIDMVMNQQQHLLLKVRVGTLFYGLPRVGELRLLFLPLKFFLCSLQPDFLLLAGKVKSAKSTILTWFA